MKKILLILAFVLGFAGTSQADILAMANHDFTRVRILLNDNAFRKSYDELTLVDGRALWREDDKYAFYIMTWEALQRQAAESDTAIYVPPKEYWPDFALPRVRYLFFYYLYKPTRIQVAYSVKYDLETLEWYPLPGMVPSGSKDIVKYRFIIPFNQEQDRLSVPSFMRSDAIGVPLGSLKIK